MPGSKKAFKALNWFDPSWRVKNDPEFRKLVEQDAELREAIAALESLESQFAELLANGCREAIEFVAAKGLPIPRNLKGWQRLARFVGISFETVRSGKLTHREVMEAVETFVERQEWTERRTQTPVEPPRKRPGRKPTIENDKALLKEYIQGIKDRLWTTKQAFANHKEMKRSTVSKALKRAEDFDKRKKA